MVPVTDVIYLKGYLICMITLVFSSKQAKTTAAFVAAAFLCSFLWQVSARFLWWTRECARCWVSGDEGVVVSVLAELSHGLICIAVTID